MEEYLRGLWVLGLPEKKRVQLEKKGIQKVEDLLMLFPRKYRFYGKPESVHEGKTAFIMKVSHVNQYKGKGKVDSLIAFGEANGKKVSVVWFHQNYLLSEICQLTGTNVLVAGECTYDSKWQQFQVISPDVFQKYIPYQGELIFREYPKIPGMSQAYLTAAIRKAVENYLQLVVSEMPFSIQGKLGLISMRKAVFLLHFPQSRQDVENAKRRIRAEKMYYFAAMMLMGEQNVKTTPLFHATDRRLFQKIVAGLPYSFTVDQEKAVREMCRRVSEGKTIHAMVQGDVGCGKSIIAFVMMGLMVGNGIQCALMAPTSVLAEQHFQDLCNLMEPHGVRVVFVPPLTSLRKKEKENLLSEIRSGISQILVGTHALLSDEIQYEFLGMVVVDEEHKFGVEQREKLLEKTSGGIHYISMSATPIPRSLAGVIYGEGTQLHLIRSMPPGRVPVHTAVSNSVRACFKFIHRQVSEGRQVYVVCPQIANNEKMEGVASVEELYSIYAKEFGEDVVCALTGRNTKSDTVNILDDFKANRKSILVATTVIEVGVNVPNANTIIIHNAERFGLAGLHQLRGRVGRGGGDAYCVLFSAEKENERLQVMCRTTDGFKIAEEDLRLRGAGDLFGMEQSGVNEYINLALDYPDEYQAVKKETTAFLKNPRF